MNFHAEGSGSPTNGMTKSPHSAEPTTTVAVSSMGSPPGADFRSAFQPACNMPAPSTARVTASVSSVAGISSCASLDGARGNGVGLLQPCLRQNAGFLEDRIGDRADVRVDPPQV